MTLREKQSVFALNVSKLIQYAYQVGYELTFGDAWRSPEECIRRGMPNSLHGDRLAIDFNLFHLGKWLTETEDHALLGDYWESLHTDNRWGGHFNDGNHYSMTHGGRK